MKIVKPSFEIIEQGPTLDDMFIHITKAGYTCYKTEKEITVESAHKFVEQLIKSKHTAVLEHGSVYLAIPKKILNISPKLRKDVETLMSVPLWSKSITSPTHFLIVTNYRVIVENDLEHLIDRFWINNSPLRKLRQTVKIISDRGVLNELVRHRMFSFCQESTRFCNYSLDKFGKEITFIEPSWFADASEDAKERLVRAFVDAEASYLILLDKGMTAQQARQVLPLGLKSEIVATAFIHDWNWFFALRAKDYTGPAHPDMKAIAVPIYEEFKKRNLVS